MRAPSKLEGKLPEAGKLAVEVVANNINKVEVVAKALGDDFLQEVAANVDVVAEVHNSIDAIEAVSTVATYLPQLTSNLSNLNEVVSNLAPVLNCSNNMATLLLLHARMADLLGVVPQLPNIKVLASIDDELVGIYEALPQIVTLVEHLDSVSNVAGVLPQLDIIFNNLAELVALGNYVDEIKLVAANMESILEVNELTAKVEEMYDAIQVIQSLVEDAHADVVVRHEDISIRHADIEAIQADVKVDKDIVAELKDTAIQEAKELHEKAVEDITQITSDAIANMEGISGTTVAELTDIKNTAITTTQAIADKAVVDTTDIKNEAISSTQSIRDEAVATTQIIKDTTIREVGILKEDIINTSTNISNNTIDTATHITEKAIADITSIKVEVEGIRDTAIEDIQAIKEEATAEADRAETWANASAVEAGKSEVSAGEANTSATEAKDSEVAAKASEVAAKDSEDVAKQKADEAAVSAEESEDSSVDSYAYKLSAELSAIAAAASETASRAAETNAIKAMESSYDYSELARLSANTSEAASADSVAAKDVAVTKATESAASAAAAKVSETLSSNSQVDAATSANSAKVSEGNAATSATAAKASETVAVSKAQEAASSATQAKSSEQSAATDASKAEEARIAAELAAGTMVGGITDMGAWDASKGTYPSKPTRPMPDGSTVRVSAFWKVVVSGVVSGVEFLVGDDLRYSAGTDEFYKVDNTDAVTSVQGKIGAVTLSPAEVGALEKPSGTFSVSTVLVAGSTNGTSKHSGFTIGKSVPSNAVFTDTVYTHPTSDGNKHVPANGTGNNNKFLMATATAGSYSWMTPTMSHIEGLPAALDAKLNAVANAVSASKLFAPVKINGVSFDGSADITITAASPTTLTRGTGLTGSNYNGGAATTWAVAYGSAAGTACQGNDARLSDARVPRAHTHTIADVTSLQTTLDSKYSASNKPSAGDVGAMAVGDAYLKSEVYTKAEVNSRTDKSIQTPKSLGTEDLDTIKTAGVYAQHANANTSSASHYPENLAGTLIVTSAAGVQQRYHVYNTSRVYTRAQYSSGGWTTWAREYNTLNKPSATDVGAEPQGAVTSHEGKANAHPISGVSGLQAALDAKVPTSRKVNNKALTGDISLTAGDVGALASGGTAVAATKLATARTIAGVSFDGTANISLTAANVGALAVGANAVSASKLATARTIALSGDATGSVTFDGTGNVTLPVVVADNSHNHAWGNITGAPATATRWPTPAEAGAVSKSGDTMTGVLKTPMLANVQATDLNTISSDSGYSFNYSTSTANGKPTGQDHAVLTQAYSSTWKTQMASDWRTNKWYVRTLENGSWKGWAEVYTTLSKPTATDVGLGSVNNTADAAKNVLSATKLTTARTIGGVTFDGTANINLPGVNTTGNQSTSGNAATATKLATPRTINGTNFDGTAAITTANWGTSRTLTIGSTGKSVNGAGNVSWTLAEIGALGATAKAVDSDKLNGQTAGYYHGGRYVGKVAHNLQPTAYNYGTGAYIIGGYVNGAPTTYGETLHIRGALNGAGQIYMDWGSSPAGTSATPSGNQGGVWFRTCRDNGDTWTNWARVYTTHYKPTAADVAALPIGGGKCTGVIGVEAASGESQVNVLKSGRTTSLYDSGATIGFYSRGGKEGDGYLIHKYLENGNITVGDPKNGLFLQGKNETFNYNSKQVYHTGFKPTAADVGAVNKAGDTMTGALTISMNGKTAMVGIGATDVFIHNGASNKYLQLKDDGTFQYDSNKVYHTGFKPTAADVGALAVEGKAADSDKLDGIDSSQVVYGTSGAASSVPSDWDAIRKSGFYDGIAVANAPTSGWFWGLKACHAYPEYGLMLVGGQSNNHYIRTTDGVGAGSWHRIYTTAYKPTPDSLGAHTAYNSLGATVMARLLSSSAAEPGAVVAGSSLILSSASSAAGGGLPGSWRCQGRSTANTSYVELQVTCWQRVA